MDILAADGSEIAQEMLSGVSGDQTAGTSGLAGLFSEAVQEEALLGVTLLKSPTASTVNRIKQISDSSVSPLQQTAVLALGAAINNLSYEDPQAAEALSGELKSKLTGIDERDELILYLNALGNAGMPSTLSAITHYLTETVTISPTLSLQAFSKNLTSKLRR